MIEKRTPEDDFNWFVKNPIRWVMKGQTLFNAAEHLADRYGNGFRSLMQIKESINRDVGAAMMADIELFQPAAMLAGFSLEVTMKAAIVGKYPERIAAGMKQSAWTHPYKASAHDLIALAAVAEISVEDRELLAILTKFSVWKGRYPSSMDGTPMYGMQTEFENLAGTHWLEIFPRFRRCYYEVRDQVRAAYNRAGGNWTVE